MMIYGAINFVLGFKHALKHFPMRHVEATVAIERVYAHYDRCGRWPDEDELYHIGQETLPEDWYFYDRYSPEEAPGVVLHGPYHMGLAYHFEISSRGKASRDWSFSEEGNHRDFRTAIEYAVTDTPQAQGQVKVVRK